MSYEQSIASIDSESVLAECGPMRLVIRAWNKKQPQIKLARQAAAESISYLERIARYRPLLSRPVPEIEELPEDELAHGMITSTRAIGDKDLTPMAAVAGTIADAVANWLFEREATRVIVDNGGDISVRLAEGEMVNVGVRPSIRSSKVSHVLRLDSRMQSWGVTTSGFGGRSFTRGIASAVTALAASASFADSASTAIANACSVEDENIQQLPAELIDPNTDLSGVPVTVKVGQLSRPQLLAAFDKALQRAKELVARGVILGALIGQGNLFSMTSSLKTFICRCVAEGEAAPGFNSNHPQPTT
jgi:ApbE superfamily uncharacterized protein (UPF0280 family)